jgi:hypothetical protein
MKNQYFFHTEKQNRDIFGALRKKKQSTFRSLKKVLQDLKKISLG